MASCFVGAWAEGLSLAQQVAGRAAAPRKQSQVDKPSRSRKSVVAVTGLIADTLVDAWAGPYGVRRSHTA